MSLPIYQRVAVTDTGDVIPGAEYTVINENTGVAQPIYSDRNGATLLTPPYFADSVGTIQFFIAQGTTFRVAASGGVGTYTDRYVYGVSAAVLALADGSATINRVGSDGSALTIQKDGTTVGSINASGGDILIGTGNTAVRFVDAESAIVPFDTNGSGRDNAINLGKSSERFKDLYLSGGVVFGTPSGAITSNTLDDYEEGLFTPFLPNSATYTVQQGIYTKVGDLVHIEIRLGWSSNGSDNDFRITGLPFTPKGIPTFSIFNNGKTGIGSNKWNPETSGNTIYLRQSDATTGLSNIVSLVANDATAAFRITGSYKTNA